MTTQPGTETAGRVIDVLLLFTDGPDELGVSRIARELGLSKAVVHRILQTLVARGMVTSTRRPGCTAWARPRPRSEPVHCANSICAPLPRAPFGGCRRRRGRR